MEVLGIDVGGSGIKGAPVDAATGELRAERFRLPTPDRSTPSAVAETVGQVARHFEWSKGAVGVGMPSVIVDGEVFTAANLSKRWIGVDARSLFAEATGATATVLNDADAAGLAEMRFGAGRDHKGVVLVLTLGTGIGSALFLEGRLFPNTELGHLEIGGKEAEKFASSSVREDKNLSWNKWARRLDRVLQAMHAYFWPDLIILGGGVSKKHEKFIPLLSVRCDVVPAQLLNQAGIVGAALAAAEGL